MADDLEQRIRERAYEIWEEEGCPEGRGDEHWQRACAEYREAREEADAGQGTSPLAEEASAGGSQGLGGEAAAGTAPGSGGAGAP